MEMKDKYLQVMCEEIGGDIAEDLAADYLLRGFKVRYRINTNRKLIPGRGNISNIVDREDSYIHRHDRKISIEMEELQNVLFPIFDNNVFISHFSKNVGIAKRIQETICRNTGINPFIDSDVWANIYKLLLNISEYCGLVTEYKLRDGGTINVHNLNEYNNIAKNLFVAFAIILQKAIEKCSAFVFVYENNDVVGDCLSDEIRITSPWVAQELYASSFIPETSRLDENVAAAMQKRASLEFIHKVSISHLHPTSLSKLINELKKYVQY